MRKRNHKHFVSLNGMYLGYEEVHQERVKTFALLLLLLVITFCVVYMAKSFHSIELPKQTDNSTLTLQILE